MNLLSKYTCILCDGLTNRNMDLCFSCEQDLPFLKNYCKKCGEPLPGNQKICGFCLNKSPLHVYLTAFFHYSCPVDKFIIDLKFKNNLVVAKVFGELLANHLDDIYCQMKTKPEVVIPVPLHASRLRERGYNQALEISRPIAKKLNMTIDKFSVRRVKATRPQVELSAKERYTNIKQAFSVNNALFNYKHVAVVDDVITTGNTINELCRVLSANGVKKIDVWCLAKSK